MITVVIPVGPEPHHAEYLDQCLASVKGQTYPASEVLLIDDMHGLVPDAGSLLIDDTRGIRVKTIPAPWHLGVAHALNFGVALASHDLVFMLGADDLLFPDCLAACVAAWERYEQRDAYYWVGVEYSDGRHQQVACGAAMVTKGLWHKTGGFPVEASTGASDAAFLSILLGNGMWDDLTVQVDPDRELYGYRVHDKSDTASKASWQGVILETRNLVTRDWKVPAWGRFR